MAKLGLIAIAAILTMFAASSAASAAKPAELAQVFDPEMIDADIAYFERVTGPARNTYGNTKVYKVGDCDVTATVAGGSVRSLRVDISPRCTFDLNRLLSNFPGKFPAPDAMTFGEFDSVTGGSGQFFADCLAQCGNAADPVIYEHWHGSRADLALEVMLEAVQVSGAVLDGAAIWRAAREKVEGEDWVVDAKFNCTREYDAVAHRAFRDVTISAIAIGHDVQPPRCESQHHSNSKPHRGPV